MCCKQVSSSGNLSLNCLRVNFILLTVYGRGYMMSKDSRLIPSLDLQRAIDRIMSAVQTFCEQRGREQSPDINVIKYRWRRLYAGLLAVKPSLDKPFPDDDRWTPWT